MAKQNWRDRQGTPPANPPQASRPAPASTPGAQSSKGGWRNRGAAAAQGGSVSPATVNAIVGIFGLAIVLALVVMLIIWLNPLPKPRLAVVSARYHSPLMPPNAFAINDGITLASQTSVLNSADADTDSLSLGGMKAQIDRLSTIEPGRYWFMWEKTTTIAYVNALGAGLWDPSARQTVPLLLPEDFEVPTQSQPVNDLRAISVPAVLDKLIECKADNKILVLDCQRMDSLWPLGVLTNDFVRSTLAHLEQLPKEKQQGLYVILSCSPGEITWSDNQKRQSPFGYYFAHGMTGLADRSDQGGNSDGRISLAEIFNYVYTNVSESARQNRADTQTPILFSFEQSPEDVALVALSSSTEFITPTALEEPDDKQLARTLEDGWKNYYRMALEKPAPLQYAANLWRYLADTLMRAEAFWRAGDLDAMRDELRNVPFREADIRDARRQYALAGSGYSLAMDRFIQNTSGGINVGGFAGGDIPVTPKPELRIPVDKGPNEPISFQSVVERTLQRATTVSQAAQRMRTAKLQEQVPPIEAYLIRMLDDHLLAPLGAAAPPDLARLARDMIERRVLAENAAVPGGNNAPEVFRWVRLRVEEADQGRRLEEDRLFATGAKPVEVGGLNPSVALPNVERQYRNAISDAEKLARAFVTRQQLLSELPFLVHLVAARSWQRSDQTFRTEIDSIASRLLKDTRTLGSLLGVDPMNWNDQAKIDREIEKIVGVTDSLQKDRARILELLQNETRALGEGKGSARTQTDWRRINDILEAPFPAVPNDPDDSARIRVNLVSRVQRPVEQSGEAGVGGAGGRAIGNVAGVSEEDQKAHAIRLARLADSFYALGTGRNLEIVNGSPAEVGAVVARAWQDACRQADSKQVDLDNFEGLFQSETARRILNGYITKKSDSSYVQELWFLNNSRFFAWHADRFAEDFWAGTKGDAEPYFARAARGYLERADALDPRGGKQFAEERKRLVQLEEFADNLKVEAEPSKVRFRGTDEETLQLGVPTPAGYPQGIAALRATVSSKAIDLRDLPQASGRLPFQYRLYRQANADDSTSLFANALFRGHVSNLTVPVLLPGGGGPTVVYKDEKPDDAQFAVRLAESERSDLKLLFVLDCSASMNDNDRMGIMRQVLTEFAETTPNNSLEVGFRLFGHSVRWDSAHPELEGPSKTDTKNILPIDWFDKDKFEQIIPELKPVGATPLFHGLIEARKDFANVKGGKKCIVVISDGEDNWAALGQGPGIKELREAYQGTGIQINAIGFQTGDAAFDAMKEIARTGGGVCMQAAKADELFSQITGLLGLVKVAAKSGSQSFPATPQVLEVRSIPIVVPPGLFDIQVTGSENKPITNRPDVRIFAGEKHEFIFQGGQLKYSDVEFTDSRPVSDPSSGVSLAVLSARPQPGGLEVQLALFKKDQVDWRPDHISVFVSSAGGGDLFTFQNLEANVPGFHVPVWRFMIEDWPANAETADIEVRWVDPGKQDDKLFKINWKDSVAGKLPQGFQITRREFEPRTIEGKRRNAAVIKLVFPENFTGEQDWSVSFDQPVSYARQTYNTTEGVYTGEFVLKREAEPQELIIYEPRPRRQGNHLTVKAVRIGNRVIN